jgi:hypothetical protein
MGTAICYDTKSSEVVRWTHAWVRVGEEVIDGNVDSLVENPIIPNQIHLARYWGPTPELLEGRRLREHRGAALLSDVDVDGIWPELKSWIDVELPGMNVRSA